MSTETQEEYYYWDEDSQQYYYWDEGTQSYYAYEDSSSSAAETSEKPDTSTAAAVARILQNPVGESTDSLQGITSSKHQFQKPSRSPDDESGSSDSTAQSESATAAAAQSSTGENRELPTFKRGFTRNLSLAEHGGMEGVLQKINEERMQRPPGEQ